MTAPDYATLIDAATWDFIHKTNDFYPPDAIGLSLQDQRAVYDRMTAAFRQPYPPGVTATDQTLGGVPVRIYAGSAVTVMYLHGGGFVVGGLHSHDDICAEICAATGCRVISVDYRLAPEHLHPAAYDDALAATRAAASLGAPLVMVGDSAGGTLAASVSHALRRSAVTVLGQVLIYAGLGGDPDTGSHLTHAHAPMLTRADVLYYRDIRHGGAAPMSDPTAAPLKDTDFTGLPPTVAISAECDPLADDGRRYRDRILAAGGQAVWIEEAGLVHAYLRARHSVPRAKASFERICRAIALLGRGDRLPDDI